jgi:hypothetical protein
MAQPNYCTPMFITLSLVTRIIIVMLEKQTSPIELLQLAVFAFLATVQLHRRRVETAMRTIFFE